MKTTQIGLFGLLLIAAAGAFVGMGLFMFRMGSDMSTMTGAVTQMWRDVSSMATDMSEMTQRMETMAGSMVAGQAGQIRIALGATIDGWRVTVVRRTLEADIEQALTDSGGFFIFLRLATLFLL